MQNHREDTVRQHRLQEVIADYLVAVDTGGAVDAEDWIRRHRDLCPELAEFICNQAEVDRLIRPSGVVTAEKAGIPGDSSCGAGLNQSTNRGAAWTVAVTHRASTASDGGDVRRCAAHKFGDHEIVREVGQGGMGVIYEAIQRSLQRTVALKMLRLGALASDEDLQRLRNEAETVAALDHPAIVPIHEVGQHDGQPYFTMKLVNGPSLAQSLEHFYEDPRAAARLVFKLAEAVDHAHQRGVLHRDLKPANVLLDEYGEPHITDFGLSRRIESDSQLTLSGAILGTPSYMAPEQATAKCGLATTATDIYGLGAILYTILTGKPPFRGDSILTTLEQVRRESPEPPSHGNAAVPRDLEAICMKCLEKRREDRYGSAAGLAADLAILA